MNNHATYVCVDVGGYVGKKPEVGLTSFNTLKLSQCNYSVLLL
jgi:hypothetical protein